MAQVEVKLFRRGFSRSGSLRSTSDRLSQACPLNSGLDPPFWTVASVMDAGLARVV
jgi:hypothetical protein